MGQGWKPTATIHGYQHTLQQPAERRQRIRGGSQPSRAMITLSRYSTRRYSDVLPHQSKQPPLVRYLVLYHTIAGLLGEPGQSHPRPNTQPQATKTPTVDYGNNNTSNKGKQGSRLSLQRDLHDDLVWIYVVPCVHPAHFGFVSSDLQPREFGSILPKPSLKRHHLGTERAHTKHAMSPIVQM